jgi:hypothetical protein
MTLFKIASILTGTGYTPGALALLVEPQGCKANT